MCIVDAWGLLCLSCISNMFDDRRLYLINGFFFRGVNGGFFCLKEDGSFQFLCCCCCFASITATRNANIIFLLNFEVRF